MGDLTDIKRRLKRSRDIKLDFWDGMRDYQGVALNITPATIQGYLKMVVEGDETVIPGDQIVIAVIKHLSGKEFNVRVSGQGLEVHVKCRFSRIERYQDNPRRLKLTAQVVDTNEKKKDVLLKLGKQIGS